ncbi:peptide chain release factor N(5)-glutamine methyltransferase [Rarobacter incanus]|uniref:peptide chain release factor N(5)-glutamine methyltransferase n=1 Tax=Rarobacter incanus TaxID=153494 RepID=A0A542SRG7_9MICO|nr:peptide chain release factor N(5)-glutamine methyltransferase [Rarobacter incanus]TQK77193.1 release factor glutamine methyltransferase [Rarobacter incanus]
MTVPLGWREQIDLAASRLSQAGIAAARHEALLLAAHAAGRSPGEMAAVQITGSLAPDVDASEAFARMVARRCERVPLQHITGVAPFRRRELCVGPGVFVPRPETEQVVEAAIRVAGLEAGRAARVADLCAGSGAIGFAIADEFPLTRVWSVELDGNAFEWTQRNWRSLPDSVRPRVDLRRADARTALHELDGSLDLVISNPPYIPGDAVPRDPEVALHDPGVALYGLGADGLEVPRGIIAAAARLLRPRGWFVMEHAETQDAAVRAMVGTDSFDSVATCNDLAGRPRMVVARRIESS